MPSIDELKKSENIAELLDEDQLAEIGHRVLQGYEIDESSREDWKATIDAAMDIAKQVMETKNHPWPNASNIRFPLITKASIDFAARTYPEIVNGQNLVKVSIIGRDDDYSKCRRGARVSQLMSYQMLFSEMNWEESTDKLLHLLPLMGTVFRKVYFDPVKKVPMTVLCRPDKIVVNYNVSDLPSARRISHIMELYSNDLIERIRRGIYREVDVETLLPSETADMRDYDAPLEILEQHCYLDLDDDGYQEPYIVTIDKKSGTVLRIFHRFKDVQKKDGKVVRIDPEHYFIDYHFIKSPDGGFYSLGLGSLLYPLNSSINTLLNQLVDAGTLSNSSGGFIGSGIRLKKGMLEVDMNKWHNIQVSTGLNLNQNIVPFPTKEPSPVLFQLLGLLIDVGKELSTTQDALQGNTPAQNVPATTILTIVEQGLKVFNAVSKRLYRSFRDEFQRLFDLNRRFLSSSDYLKIVDDPEANLKADFEFESRDIVPSADPSLATDAQRLAKAQALLAIPGLNPAEVAKFFLHSLKLPEEQIQQLLPPLDAPPPPEAQKVMAEIQRLNAEAQARMIEAQATIEKNQLAAQHNAVLEYESRARADEAAARIVKMQEDAQHNRNKLQLVENKQETQNVTAEFDRMHQREKDEVELALKAMETQIKAQQTEDSYEIGSRTVDAKDKAGGPGAMETGPGN